jgi:hypothetical protein
MFFDSADALVPQDVNGTEDVYEWEPPGVGGCVVGGARYSDRSDGCVGLMSSGEATQESAFVDASESGGDMFFLTSARLVPADTDAEFDMYDAHECTVALPCLSGPAVSPPPCVTADSCRLAPSPQPGVFGAPGSTVVSGSGNLVSPGVESNAKKAKPKPKKAKSKRCGRGAKRRHGRCVRRRVVHAKKSDRRGK